jgi:uncharacterized membrane protein YeaQ/YmgE (transglycosylase-associated protein family)
MVWHWIVKILLWALAGFLAGKLMKDGKPEGWIGNVILGLIGGLVGSLLFSLIGLGSNGFIGDVLVSTVGACIVIWLVRKFAN